VFALEIAVAGLFRPDENTREEAVRLLEQRLTLVRHPLGADQFECAWHWTAVAALEGMIRPAIAEPFVRHAIQRCPNEPRFRLAAGVIADQRWPVGTAVPLPGQTTIIGPNPAQRAEVQRLLAEAMWFPAVAAEALTRAAWLALRLGDLDRAEQLVDTAGDAGADPQLQYMRLLVRGQVLQARGRADESEAAFRAAVKAWPRAQSARVALMALLLSRGAVTEAEALAETVQSAPAGESDPWWRYWQGDFRAYSGILARLREMAR
jgi:tetratricopeptide (TPR) repeat protein